MKNKREVIIKKRVQLLITVEDLLRRFEGRCSRSMLQMLRFRWKLFPPAIIVGRIGSKAGIDGYLIAETIKYLEKILELKEQGKTYRQIEKLLKDERDKIFEITARAKKNQFYLSDTSLESIQQSIQRLEELAQRCGQTIFNSNLVKSYQEAMEKYAIEENASKKNDLEKLLIVYARFLRASANTYTDLTNSSEG